MRYTPSTPENTSPNRYTTEKYLFCHASPVSPKQPMYGPQVEPQQQFKAQGRILTGTVSLCRFKIVQQQFTAITNDFKTWVHEGATGCKHFPENSHKHTN